MVFTIVQVQSDGWSDYNLCSNLGIYVDFLGCILRLLLFMCLVYRAFSAYFSSWSVC